MINRNVAEILEKIAKGFPIVTVTGPRQSGKTTLVKNLFPKKEYISFENLSLKKEAEEDPKAFLAQFPEGAILDEVQRVPEIFSYLQVLVDEKNQAGMFILTGSNQFEYMQNLTQSLAGRTAILKLLPFSYSEIYGDNLIDVNELLLKGFYPRIFDKKLKPNEFYPSYTATYLERDVRQISKIKNLSVFQDFLELCAGRTGQILNKNSLANECGVSQPTIEEWISILEASFIVFRLRPYSKNLNKRVVKSPKLYFFDTGLVCNLLNINSVTHLKRHPLRGEIYETFVISELLKIRFNQGYRSNLFFYRDSNMNEVDVVIDSGFGPIPIEVKIGMTVNSSFFKSLKIFRNLTGNYYNSGLVYSGNRNYKYKDNWIRNYTRIDELYDNLTDEKNWK